MKNKRVWNFLVLLVFFPTLGFCEDNPYESFLNQHSNIEKTREIFFEIHGEPQSLKTLDDNAQIFKGAGPFTHHVLEARKLNSTRKPIYASLTGNRSKKVSNRLINQETRIIPAAYYFDLKARNFPLGHEHLLEKDFFPFTQIKEPTAPLKRVEKIDAVIKNQVKQKLEQFNQTVKNYISIGDFSNVADECADFIYQINRLENQHHFYLAMTLHCLESLGISALNAELNRISSGGKTEKFSILFLKSLRIALDYSLKTDLEAQESHLMGVGILVNDLPEIPFLKQYKTR